MKGYRTIILQIAMTLLLGGTVQVTDLPPEMRALLTLGVGAWGLLGMLLRIVTTTPVGQRLEAKVESDLGITQAQADAIIARLPEAGGVPALQQQIQAIADDLAALKAATATPAPAPAKPAAAGLAG